MMQTQFRGLAGLAWSLICSSALADTPAEECAKIDVDAERLACYDASYPPNSAPSNSTDSTEDGQESAVQARRSQESDLQDQWFSITPHRPNYALPVAYNRSSDYSTYGETGELYSDMEFKFQLSLKTRMLSNLWKDSSLWFAYTQQSFWQLYADKEASAPFRETNHEPEIFWEFPLQFRVLGFDAKVATFSFNHQSNGQADPLSRSWNRLAGEIALERGRIVLSAKSWMQTDDHLTDNGLKVADYMGRVAFGAAYKGDKHTFTLGLKNSLAGDFRSGIEAGWTFPFSTHVRGYVQLYSGYGENLIDMDNYSNRIGVGLALTDWL